MPIVRGQAQTLIENRISAIRRFHDIAGFQRAEIDVSGGIDSAVTVMLLALALGPENVTAVYTGIQSSDESLVRAREVCEAAKVKLIEIDLSVIFNKLIEYNLYPALQKAGYNLTNIINRADQDLTIIGSFRSCLRAPIGRVFNRLTGNGIRHGTGNECEDRWLRYYQRGGDGEVDVNILGNNSKGEIFQLGVALGIPKSILTAKPSHDLHEGKESSFDEVELLNSTGVPWTYSEVDPLTGEYTYVGTIERMSRFIDREGFESDYAYEADNFYTIDEPGAGGIFAHHPSLTDLAKKARSYFKNYTFDEVLKFLTSAQNIELKTRHKWNPNCWKLGTRNNLVDAGILTNELPDL